jgi:hypothetical protein
MLIHGNLDVLNKRKSDVKKHCKETYAAMVEQQKQEKRDQWVAEKHICEHCGKTMTEKFGSGRFCCRACANSRKRPQDVKDKIRETVKAANQTGFTKHGKSICQTSPEARMLRALERHRILAPTCPICGELIPFEKRYKKTCGKKECVHEAISRKAKETGGLRPRSGTGKSGWYKGYFCNSTYELVYVIYNIDHDISFKRFKDFYTYEWNGKTYKYYPDFELKDGSLVEIKGYFTEKVAAKTAAVKDRKITVLYKDDLKYAFDWVKEHYQYKELQDLYESNSSNK